MLKLNNVISLYPTMITSRSNQNSYNQPKLNVLSADTISFTCNCQKAFPERVSLLSGRANPELTQSIAESLNLNVGDRTLKNFSDGETYVKISDDVQGKDVYIIQPSAMPVNDSIMELLLMADATKRANAEQVIAIIPYMGYERQDRKAGIGEPIAAKLHADIITTSGVDKVISVDLHAAQIEGFFNNKNVINISAIPVLSKYIKSKNIGNMVVVSPDAGGAKRAELLAEELDCSYAMIHKKREKHNEAKAVSLVGDINGKNCILFDDMIDTAGTIVEAANMLKEKGAKSVYVCVTHGIFSGQAYDRLEKAPIEEVIVTNTLPLKENAPKKITQVDISPLLAGEIKRISDN